MISDVFVSFTSITSINKATSIWPCFLVFCVLLLRTLSGSWLRPGLNLNSFSSFCPSVSYWGALPTGTIFKQNSPLRVFRGHNMNLDCRSTWGLVVAKTQRIFFPLHPLPTPKSHRPFFLPSLLHEESLIHPHTGGVVVFGPQVYARSS